MGGFTYPNNIFLIGMPGSGKSTLGKELSEKLGSEFYDLDQYIEAEAGKDINRIFSEDGENGFRLIENRCLRRLGEQPQAKVISTGGGTPCFHQNIDYINGIGVSIFLNVPLEIIARRLLSQGTDDRPLLKDKTPQELLGQLQDHFLQRKSCYLKAHIHLEGGSISVEQLLDELQSL